jgi:dihydroorotate dehydrogenase (fumarate)
MDVSTRYLGLRLAHPFMPGASPLTASLDGALRLEDGGASAIVLPSLFEEQIGGAAKAPAARGGAAVPRSDGDAFAAERYLQHLTRLRDRVHLPVIASLNGTTADGWLEYARLIERAGASALELNFYHVATDPLEDGWRVERRVVDIVAVLKESIRIPLAVKLSPFYSSLPDLASHLDQIGADGLVLFNRFYQPDIDVESRMLRPQLQLSDSSELLLRLHWTAILAGRIRSSLAISGGVHEPLDAVKAIMAGADAVQLVSALLRHGPAHLMHVRRGVERWAEEHEYGSLDELRGTVSLARCADPAILERSSYIRTLQSWPACAGSSIG